MTHPTYARRLRLGPLLAGGFLGVAAITLMLVTRLIAPATQAVSWTLVYVNGPPQTSTVVVVDEHWNDCGTGWHVPVSIA